jgi:hypothetical protein
MKKTAIGHVRCPVCDHADAEVKEDKNGHAFIFCPDCAAQTFTRNPHRDAQLRKRMRPVTVTVTGDESSGSQTETAPNTQPASSSAPGTAGPAATNTPPGVQGKPKKNTGWLMPLLAAGDA